MNHYLFCLIILVSAVAISSAEPVQRIVGGHYAEEAEFPHQIALFFDGRFNCGGSIISSQYVLTAAHCVYDVHDPTQLTIVHGSTNFHNGTTVTVAKVIPHPEYGSFLNDVALLKLTNELKFDEHTKAVPLRNSSVPVGAVVVISGFGRTGSNDPPSENLKYNEMVVVSNEECARVLGIDYEGVVCFNGEIENGACMGDSGGPAVYENTLVGVANFVADGCGTKNPDGYAKVSFYLDWIRENTKDSKPVLTFL